MSSGTTANKDLAHQPFNFGEKPFPLPTHFPCSPLSWASLFKKDLYLTAFCATSHGRGMFKLSNLNLTEKDDGFLQKWRDENRELIPLGVSGEKKIFRSTSNNRPTLNEDEFMDKLDQSLSDSKLVELLLTRFFNTELYLMVPFVNKDHYLTTLKQLMGSNYNKKLKTGDDLSIIGILLIIMKLTSASFYNFGKKLHPHIDGGDSLGTQYIIDHPISKHIPELIKTINLELQKLATTETSLDIYTFFLVSSYFSTLDPDFSSEQPNGSLDIGYLLKYAMKCSLNRDPDLYIDDTSGSIHLSDKDLFRRLWWGLVSLDYYQYLIGGYPKLIDLDNSDTRLPTLDEKKAGLSYLLNKAVVDQIKVYQQQIGLLWEKLVVVKHKSTFSEIESALKDLETYIGTLKTFDEIMESPDSTVADRHENINNYCALLSSYSLHYMTCYHFFLRYNTEKRYESSFNYLLKCIDSFQKIYKSGTLFLDLKTPNYNFQKTFGSGLLVFSRLETALHQFIMLPISIVSRLQASVIFESERSSQEIGLCDLMITHLTKVVSHFMNLFSTISDVYYHLWVLTKINGAMLVPVLESFKVGSISPVSKKLGEFIEKYKFGDVGFQSVNYSQFMILFEKIDTLTKICDDNQLHHQQHTQKTLNQITPESIPRSISTSDESQNQLKQQQQQQQQQNTTTTLTDKGWLDEMLQEFGDNKRSISEDSDSSIISKKQKHSQTQDQFQKVDMVEYGITPLSAVSNGSNGFNDVSNGLYDEITTINDMDLNVFDMFLAESSNGKKNQERVEKIANSNGFLL